MLSVPELVLDHCPGLTEVPSRHLPGMTEERGEEIRMAGVLIEIRKEHFRIWGFRNRLQRWGV
jgi:hypothetical protein